MTNRVTEAAERAGSYATETLSSAKEKVSSAYASAREQAATARDRTVRGVEDGPIAALAGGLALGALIGLLLPRTRKEEELLGPLGERLSEAARTAAGVAREAGQQTLDEMGINREVAREKVKQLVEAAGKAAGSAGSAAVEAIRHPAERP